MTRSFAACAVVLAAALMLQATCAADARADGFDHDYRTYAEILKRHVRYPRVDYAALKADRAPLDRVVAEFDATGARGEPGWTREQRMAFWINAYNLFTLRAIVDQYPIRGSWLSLSPRNSIRQIDGVWTELTWRAAGRTVTLDDIEHRILRPTFKDARIHFAVNCASVSCPPLETEPYRPAPLDAQFDAAGKRFLSSPEGLKLTGDTLHVSSIFKCPGRKRRSPAAVRVRGPAEHPDHDEAFFAGFDLQQLIQQFNTTRDPRFFQDRAFQAPRAIRVGAKCTF